MSDTVDGSEIWRSPVEVGSLSYYLRRVLAPSQVVGTGISEPSTVLVPFFGSQQKVQVVAGMFLLPIQSIYGIFACIWVIFMVNVG